MSKKLQIGFKVKGLGAPEKEMVLLLLMLNLTSMSIT